MFKALNTDFIETALSKFQVLNTDFIETALSNFQVLNTDFKEYSTYLFLSTKVHS